MTSKHGDDNYLLKLADDDDDAVNEGFYWTRNERNVWFITLFAGTTALYASRTTMPLVAPAVSSDLHWSKTETGTILSSFFWGYTLSQVAGGYLSDRFGAERVLFAAGLGWGLTTFWFHEIIYFFTDRTSAIEAIIFFRVFLGACQGVHFPAMASFSAKNVSTKDRSVFFSFSAAGSSIGTLISGTVGSYINETLGWPYVFYVIGFISLLWVGLMKTYAMEIHRNRRHVIGVTSSTPLMTSKAFSASDTKVPWLTYISAPALWACMICHFCQNNCFFLLLSWLPTYFHDNFPEAQSWIFNIVPWILALPGTLAAGHVSRSLLKRGVSVCKTRKALETGCMASEIICLLLLGVTTSFPIAVLITMVAMFFKSFHSFGSSIVPLDIAPKHSGFVHGIVNAFGSLAGFIGVYIAGYILELTSSWSAVFNVTALINLVGLSVFIIFGSSTPIL